MNKKYIIYKTDQEWLEADRPDDSYIQEKIPFTITCNKCNSVCILYTEHGNTYESSHLIICENCGSEESLYGVDG